MDIWPPSHRDGFNDPMFHLLAPHYRISAVQELTAERLRRAALDSLLLDADCTLKRYGAEEPIPEALAWLTELRKAGIGLCLVSNGFGNRIGRFAQRLDLPYVALALKPLPWGCRRAIKRMNFKPSHTAMVGDQVFADILAGRLAGLTTILVDPIHPEEEPWFTRLKRRPEQLVLRRVVYRELE